MALGALTFARTSGGRSSAVALASLHGGAARTLAALSLVLLTAACVPASGNGQGGAMRPVTGPLKVTNQGQAFTMSQGAEARKLAEAECAANGQRLRPSIYDRFEAGAWVYVEGCA